MNSPGYDGAHLNFGLWPGKVVDVDDPQRAHRIRASIAGVTSKTAWALPRGGGAGGPHRGGNVAPRVGQDVLIAYLGGNENRPIWEGAHWGEGEVPADIVAAGSAAAEVQAFEARSGDAAFRLTLDERAGSRKVRLAAVRLLVGGGETVIAALELDLEQNVLDLFGMAGVQIRSLGFVDITALAARVLKRRVGRSRRPI